MNHAFKLVYVPLCLVGLQLGFISMAHSLVKLVVQAVASLNKGLSLLIQDCNSCILSKAFLLPL